MDKKIVVYIHNEQLYNHKKKGNPSFGTRQRGLNNILLIEISQAQKEKIVYNPTLIKNLKKSNS
jgi:hypothetical protein